MNNLRYKILNNRINTYKDKKMTYIVGAKCKDGIVLIADKKICIGETEEECEKKLIRLSTEDQIVVGASGLSGLFEKFINKLGDIVDEKAQKGNYLITEIIEDCEDIANELTERYFKRIRDSIDVLIAIRSEVGITNLHIVYGINGFSESVKKYKAIGHGEPYGSLFLKKFWDENLSMKEFAKIGYFIINLIEEMKLDNSVGYEPQVWFIPDITEKESKELSREEINKKYPLREADKDELKEMRNFSNKLFGDLNNFIEDLKNKNINSN